MKEAMFYKKLAKKRTQCVLCPRNCLVADGGIGNCGARKNIGGKLFSLVYGKIASMAVDPIEKKPLHHFAPGSRTFSIATVGCNFHCRFCQNFEISQPKEIFGSDLSPRDVVSLAKKTSHGISYTYTEPTIFYEFVLGIAKLAKKEGLYNVLVTNGYINAEPLKKLAPYIDAANVDIKSMSDAFHQKLCGVPSAKPVPETVRRMRKSGIHVEITNLVIPGENDSDGDFEALASWLASIDKSMPLHFSRYFPAYLMTSPPTPITTLLRARSIAKKHGIQYVYVGNVGQPGLEDTKCPFCDALLMRREGFAVAENKILDKACPKCGKEVLLRGIEYLK